MNREFAKEGQNSRGTHIDETYARSQHRYAFAISARERNKRVEAVVKRSSKKKKKNIGDPLSPLSIIGRAFGAGRTTGKADSY